MLSKTLTILAAMVALNASLTVAFQQGPPQPCAASAIAGDACTCECLGV